MPEVLAADQVTLATVWLLGVSMGVTACTVTCLPFMGTWTLGRASRQREAFLHVGVFLAGRVMAYAVLAMLSGALGAGLAKSLGGSLGNGLIGLASIFAGVWLLAKAPGKTCHAGAPASTIAPIHVVRPRADSLPPLFLGATLSLTPCTPLASLLALAAHAGSAAQGAAYGFAFGLGAAMTPLLVLVPMAGKLGRSLCAGRNWLTQWLQWGAASVLIVLGLRRLLLAV